MKRKQFLGACLAMGIPMLSPATVLKKTSDPFVEQDLHIPPFLKPGDTIGITSPAGFINLEDIQPAILRMQQWGYRVRIGSTIGKRDFTFGGTDEERLADIQNMLDDPDIHAVMCARGGYGIIRIIDRINFDAFRRKPKWIIGFSDITVMHNHILQNYNIASLHSKMCNSFPSSWALAEPIQIETIESIRQCLDGSPMLYSAAANSNNRTGSASGQLVGGNAKMIESLAGSKSEMNTDHKILFLEDTGEYLYSIDRMFWNLKRSGKLKKLSGLIIGGFKVKPDDAGEEFGKTLKEIVMEKVKNYHYPVCFDFPVGHQKNNFALKHGAMHELDVRNEKVNLRSIS